MSSIQNIPIDIDRMPCKFYEAAHDWSDIAITRLLTSPLFVEKPARELRASLVAECARIDECSWKVTLSPTARWSNGEHISSKDICEQIVRVRKAAAAALPVAMMLGSMSIRSSDTFNVVTRIPV